MSRELRTSRRFDGRGTAAARTLQAMFGRRKIDLAALKAPFGGVKES